MAELNKVMLIGNVTRDPELRYTGKGTAVCEVGVAINHRWRDANGNDKEEVTFVNVQVWGKQAEAVGKYVRKGQPIFIEGRLKYEQWEKNGQKHSALRVHAERTQFLSHGGGSKSSQSEPSQNEPREKLVNSASLEPDLAGEDIAF